MNKLYKKILIIILWNLLFFVQISFGQKINFIFSNYNDEKILKNRIISETQSKLIDFQNSVNKYDSVKKEIFTIQDNLLEVKNLIIDIVFFDSDYIGTLKLKKSRNIDEQYYKKWEDINKDKFRILFFFIKENEQYILKKFLVSEKMYKSQIPELVYEYINSQIVLPNINNSISCINKCLYAFSQCFNLDYAKTLKEFGPKMVECKYFRKGYTCYIGGLTFIVQPIEIERDEILNKKLGYIIETNGNILTNNNILKNAKIENVYIEQNRTATVFDFALNHKLYYENVNIPNSTELNLITDFSKLVLLDDINQFVTNLTIPFKNDDLFLFENDGSKNTQDITSYTYVNSNKSKSTSLTKLNQFCDVALSSNNIIELIRLKENKTNEYKPRPTENYLNYKTQYKITLKYINATSTSYLNNGEDNPNAIFMEDKQGYALGFGNFDKCRPTWCNVFAKYLASKYFAKTVVPAYSANEIHKYFASNSIKNEKGGNNAYNQFSSLKDVDKKFIWEDYVNKGFPVYFTISANGHGHIETGFPAYMLPINSYYHYREDSDKQYKLISNDNYDCMTIGAGSYLGFKNYIGYNDAFFRDKTLTATIYLEYLKE